MAHAWSRGIVALVGLFASVVALALGTVAGTNIQGNAQVTYNVGAATLTTNSNTTTITVTEVLDVAVTLNTATISVAAGATQQELVFTVTNTGNGSEAFSLAGLSTLPGDDFDPILATPTFIYFDSDDSGDLSAGDVPYAAGSNDPVLAADASVRVLVVNDIPSGVVDGQRGRSQLTASAISGTGAPGSVVVADGIEVVVGTSGAVASALGEYLVQSLQISAVKSQVVVDPFNGARPIPGARIDYQVIVTATGTGTATNATFSDEIPANTTYVAGSLSLNGQPLSDSAGNDAGEYAATPTPRVIVSLGDLDQASGPQTIAFAVTIN